jgi:hypothetical protein
MKSPRGAFVRARIGGVGVVSAGTVVLAILPASAAPTASVVQGSLAVTGAITVHSSYDTTAACEDGVKSQQQVTLRVNLKSKRIIIASALGAAAGIVHGASSSVAIEQNGFSTSSRCDGNGDEPPSQPECEPTSGKAMVMLTQNPPQGTLEPVPLEAPRLSLVVNAADANGGVGADCARYWPGFAPGTDGEASLGLGTSRLWSLGLPSGLQVSGRNGLAAMKKGSKKRWVINVTGPCDGFSGTASPRARPTSGIIPTAEPIQTCELTGQFLLTFTKR